MEVKKARGGGVIPRAWVFSGWFRDIFVETLFLLLDTIPFYQISAVLSCIVRYTGLLWKKEHDT
jgi:hypothetical protein